VAGRPSLHRAVPLRDVPPRAVGVRAGLVPPVPLFPAPVLAASDRTRPRAQPSTVPPVPPT